MEDDIMDEHELHRAIHSADFRPTPRKPATAVANQPHYKPNPPIEQPKPQALPSRASTGSILVSSRQKGNPILNNVRSLPWEYSDIPADYVLGATTCALFLSLKYHRLHPEYVYGRIRDLAGKYNLRILLTMVDIENHEEPLKELSKTSLINNVTIILCWSAQEAGRYLELFKMYEHAAPTSIRAQQSNSYSDKLVEFITAPRSINKTDAVGLVSNFGSIRTAINAQPEEVAMIAGWGEKKVQWWCNSVREPFRTKRAAKRGVDHEDNEVVVPTDSPKRNLDRNTTIGSISKAVSSLEPRASSDSGRVVADITREKRTHARPTNRPDQSTWEPGEDDEEALREMTAEGKGTGSVPVDQNSSKKRRNDAEGLSEGISAALAKLRQQS
jgi:DNA excision repair protein ERCC-1